MYIGENCNISCLREINIGSDVIIESGVMINDNSHGNASADDTCLRPNDRPLNSKGPITIGSKVFIGEKSCILANVTIGDGAIVLPNSVVTKDVPKNFVVGGIPASKISVAS